MKARILGGIAALGAVTALFLGGSAPAKADDWSIDLRLGHRARIAYRSYDRRDCDYDRYYDCDRYPRYRVVYRRYDYDRYDDCDRYDRYDRDRYYSRRHCR